MRIRALLFLLATTLALDARADENQCATKVAHLVLDHRFDEAAQHYQSPTGNTTAKDRALVRDELQRAVRSDKVPGLSMAVLVAPNTSSCTVYAIEFESFDAVGRERLQAQMSASLTPSK